MVGSARRPCTSRWPNDVVPVLAKASLEAGSGSIRRDCDWYTLDASQCVARIVHWSAWKMWTVTSPGGRSGSRHRSRLGLESRPGEYCHHRQGDDPRRLMRSRVYPRSRSRCGEPGEDHADVKSTYGRDPPPGRTRSPTSWLVGPPCNGTSGSWSERPRQRDDGRGTAGRPPPGHTG